MCFNKQLLLWVLKTVTHLLFGPTEEKRKGKAIAVEADDEAVKRRVSIADYVVEQSDLLTIRIFSMVHLIQDEQPVISHHIIIASLLRLH
jgi:hypothetical protein